MELTEVTTFSYPPDGLQDFSLKISPNGIFSLLGKSTLRLLKPKFIFKLEINRLQYEEIQICAPHKIPMNELNVNEGDVYKSASENQRQKLLLELQYLPKISHANPQSREVAWSHDGTLSAYLNNFGAIEIFDGDQRVFEINGGMMVNIQQKVNSFDKLEGLVHDMLINLIAFDPRSNERLLVVTKSGKIALILLKDTPKVISIKSEEKGSFTALKWFNDYLILGTFDSKILLYQITSDDEIKFISTLWPGDDEMSTSAIEVIEMGNYLVVLSVKIAFVFVTFVNLKDLSVTKTAHQLIPGRKITGIHNLSSSDFLVSTMDNQIFLLKISHQTLSLEMFPIKFDFPYGYTIKGLTGSINGAFIAISAIATAPYDHLKLREPVSIFFYKWSHIEPVKSLIDNPSLSFNGFMDFVELTRFLCAKDFKIYKFSENLLFETIMATDPADLKFFYLLKIAILLNAARYSCVRFRGSCDIKTTEDIQKRIESVFSVVASSLVLQNCSNNVSKQLHVTNIREYLKTDPALPNYKKIQQKLEPHLKKLVEDTKAVFQEECAYCDKILPIDSLKCEGGHQPLRCCVSLAQLTMDLVSCSQCLRVISKELSESQRDIKCILCDIPFNKS